MISKMKNLMIYMVIQSPIARINEIGEEIILSRNVNTQMLDSPLFQSCGNSKFSLDYLYLCGGALIESQDETHTKFNYGSHYFQQESSNNTKM
jgi:hypothetical protein